MAEHLIAGRRLHAQQITDTVLATPREVVAWLGAIQGQDYPGAKWSVGLRLPHSTDADVEGAIDSGAVVRTWLMRGTLHLVAAEDVHWLLKLVEPSVAPHLEGRFADFGYDAHMVTRAFDIISRALEGGRRLERLQLLALLQQQGIPAQGPPGRYLLHRASAAGLVGQSVQVSGRQTFISLGHLPPSRYRRDEALAELARRYFKSRGPTTVHDFAGWAALKLRDARAGLDAVQHELASETYGQQTYWMSPAARALADVPASVYALPGFDEFLLGYRERGASLDPDHYSLWCPGKNGMFNPTIVSGGRVIGMWKRTLKQDTVRIEAAPIRPLTEAERAGFEADARRYAAFLGREAVFS